MNVLIDAPRAQMFGALGVIEFNPPCERDEEDEDYQFCELVATLRLSTDIVNCHYRVRVALCEETDEEHFDSDIYGCTFVLRRKKYEIACRLMDEQRGEFMQRIASHQNWPHFDFTGLVSRLRHLFAG